MADQTRELALKLTVKGDVENAGKGLKILGGQVDDLQKKIDHIGKGLKGLGGGGGSSGGGFTPGPTPGSTLANWPQNLGRVSAFDRPIPVIIMGPRPLPVHDVGAGGHGGGGGGGGGGHGGGGGGGGLSLAGLMRYLAVPGGAYAAAHFLTGQLTRSQDPYMTSAQNERATAMSLPFGQTAVGFHDAMTGRAAAFQQVHVNAAFAGMQNSTSAQLQGFNLGYQSEQARLSGEAGWYKGASPALSSTTSTATIQGRQQYEIEMKTLPLRQATLRTEREYAGLTREVVEREKIKNKTLQEQVFVRKELSEVQAKISSRLAGDPKHLLSGAFSNISGPGSLYGTSTEYQQDLARVGTLTNRDQQINAYREREEGEIVGLQKRIAGASGAMRTARARQSLLTAAETHESRAQASRQLAGGIGNLDPVQRQMGLYGLRALKSGTPIWQLPPEFQSAAQAIAPEYVQNQVQQHALGSPEYAAAVREGFSRDVGAGFNQEEALAKKARAGLDQEVFNIEGQTAGLFAKAGRDLGGIVQEIMQKGLSDLKIEFENRLRQQREP